MGKFPFAKIALKNLFTKPSTVNFPAVNVDAKPFYRGRIVYDAEKCTGCKDCQTVCSPSAITQTKEKTPEGTKVHFTVDLTSCTFCGTCQDFCTQNAISLSDDYHMVASNPEDLFVKGTRLKKYDKIIVNNETDCIYCSLCAKNCAENAITVDRATKTWTFDVTECVECGHCIDKCPKKCLAFEKK